MFVQAKLQRLEIWQGAAFRLTWGSLEGAGTVLDRTRGGCPGPPLRPPRQLPCMQGEAPGQMMGQPAHRLSTDAGKYASSGLRHCSNYSNYSWGGACSPASSSFLGQVQLYSAMQQRGARPCMHKPNAAQHVLLLCRRMPGPYLLGSEAGAGAFVECHVGSHRALPSKAIADMSGDKQA
jgi:hypothetical protein